MGKRHLHLTMRFLAAWAAAFVTAGNALAAEPSADQDPADVKIATYNLQNYLVMERRETGGTAEKPKPEAEIDELIRILTEIKPDVLGVCEIGDNANVEDLRERLKKAGLDYPHLEFVDGPDPRKLALFSRYPFASTQSSVDVSYELNGQPAKVRRGFLDVTLQINPDYQLRMVGVHLKSKRAVPEGEAIVRRHEAHLLRERVDGILKEHPKTNLLLYGDFNDTKNEPPIHEVMGPRGGPASLTDLWLRDSVGDHWTHYWKAADLYSRIDYFFVSTGLKPEVVESKSYVYRSPRWNQASDHRPIVTVIHPVEQK